MSIGFDGIGAVVATFLVEEGAQVGGGAAVALVGDSTVGLGSAGGVLCGVVVSGGSDGLAGVQMGGLAQVPYSGTAPAVGINALAVDGAGKIMVSDAGAQYLVAAVDETAMTAVIKL